MDSVKLTKREKQIVELVVEGKSSQEIADGLYVCKKTVDFHLANAYEKLRVNNRAQAVIRAVALGIATF